MILNTKEATPLLESLAGLEEPEKTTQWTDKLFKQETTTKQTTI